MPAFLPTYSILKEVGCYMIDGYYTKNLLADSPDGLIEYTHDDNNDNCCHDDLQFGEHEKITVEIKCPFPESIESNNALQIAKILCNAGFDAHEGYIK